MRGHNPFPNTIRMSVRSLDARRRAKRPRILYSYVSTTLPPKRTFFSRRAERIDQNSIADTTSFL